MEVLIPTLSAIATSTPVIIVWVIGLVLALSRWRRLHESRKLISAAAWALVICAMFGWRDQGKKQEFFPPPPPTFGHEPREQNATPGFTQR